MPGRVWIEPPTARICTVQRPQDISIQNIHSSSTRRQRPIESTLPVHILPSLHRLVPPHPVIPVIPRHFRILRALEPSKPHHLHNFPRLIVHISRLVSRRRRVIAHLDVDILLDLRDCLGLRRACGSLHGSAGLVVAVAMVSWTSCASGPFWRLARS
jgi:hypothetical protein